MTTSITALTPIVNFNRATNVRPVNEDLAQRANAPGKNNPDLRANSGERVIEGELLQNVRSDFTIDDFIESQSFQSLDPRLATPSAAGQGVSASDVAAIYASNSVVFSGVERTRVDTFA